MQVIENWAWLTCTLKSVADHGQYIELDARLESTAPVPGFPDLIAQFSGGDIRIRIAAPLPHPVAGRFRIRARLTAPDTIWGAGESLAAAG